MKTEDILDPIPEGSTLGWTWLRFAGAYFLGGIVLLLPVAVVAAVVRPERAWVGCFPDMRPYWAIGLVLPAVLTMASRNGSRNLALASCAGVPSIVLALWYSREIDAFRSFGGSIDPATAWESLESGLAWWTGQVVPGIVAGAVACAWVVIRSVKREASA